jgi:hypothetical protein
VAAVLVTGGRFVFDLFTRPHFRHWLQPALTDLEEVIAVKRGTWNAGDDTGSRYFSGAFRGDGGTWKRFVQEVTARHYPADIVAGELGAAGLRVVGSTLTMPPCPCQQPGPEACRTLFEAVKDG